MPLILTDTKKSSSKSFIEKLSLRLMKTNIGFAAQIGWLFLRRSLFIRLDLTIAMIGACFGLVMMCLAVGFSVKTPTPMGRWIGSVARRDDWPNSRRVPWLRCREVHGTPSVASPHLLAVIPGGGRRRPARLKKS